MGIIYGIVARPQLISSHVGYGCKLIYRAIIGQHDTDKELHAIKAIATNILKF